MSKYLLIAVVIILFGNFGNAQTTQVKVNSETFRSPFRYVIVSNKTDPAISRKDEPRRFVEVFLDSKSFTKENLITLLKLVSKRYPKPNLLYIAVFTNLDDIETPEEREQSKFSDTEGGELTSDNAIFIRTREKSFFYIYFANGDFDEVEIK
jgi:hypothetical protein